MSSQREDTVAPLQVGTIVGIWRYPVKSMGGQQLDEVDVTAAGLDGDRRYAVRDVETGKIASAKRPGRWRVLLDCTAAITTTGTEITFPDGKVLAADDPVVHDALTELTGRLVRIELAGDGASGSYESEWPEIDGLALRGTHDFPVALVTEAETFVDVSAVHLLTTATLHHLAELADEPELPPRRFRPNFLVDTPDEGPAFLENRSTDRRLRLGPTMQLTGARPAPRCVMTTVAQPGLPRNGDVLRAAAHNKHDLAPPGMAAITFGCAGTYSEIATQGSVRDGDHVTLLG